MKVKIATQALSKSVADALLYLCNDLKLQAFQNVKAAVTFFKNFNDLFDIFNERNKLAKYVFKRPLSLATAQHFFSFFDEVSIYIKDLKLGSIPIIQSARKTGFLGFLIDIESLKRIYKAYILEKRLNFILTNKISQDHLELFFGSFTKPNNSIKTLPSAVLNHFDHYLFDDGPVDGHAIQLMRLILHNYFKLRIHQETIKNIDLSTKTRVRSIFTKTIFFRHD
nr:unnamed protein product [Callosobruchus analis]